MCRPGMHPSRTDEQIAKEARFHIKALLVCLNGLRDRGYTCKMHWNSADHPVSVDVRKEVSL